MTDALSDVVDVLIAGGGPAGLQAALTLGRARKRVLVVDGGPRRNARTGHMNNFVSRDGIAPADFRREARAQIAKYPNVSFRDQPVDAVTGARGDFRAGAVRARRVLLATGMIDQVPALDGLEPLWGHSVFQCPYCHGWEARQGRWGYYAPDATAPHVGPFVMMLRGWSPDVTIFTDQISDDVRRNLVAAKVQIESAGVKRLIGAGRQLEAVELGGGCISRASHSRRSAAPRQWPPACPGASCAGSSSRRRSGAKTPHKKTKKHRGVSIRPRLVRRLIERSHGEVGPLHVDVARRVHHRPGRWPGQRPGEWRPRAARVAREACLQAAAL